MNITKKTYILTTIRVNKEPPQNGGPKIFNKTFLYTNFRMKGKDKKAVLGSHLP